MRRLKVALVEKDFVDQIFCNICGREIVKNTFGEFEDHVHLVKLWGYHSSKDGVKNELDICEECFDKILGNLKIPLE